MSAVFLKLVNLSITASWLILAVLAARFLLRKAPKWVSCLLWALVAVRLLCPFSLESRLSLVPETEPISAPVVQPVSVTAENTAVQESTVHAAEQTPVITITPTGDAAAVNPPSVSENTQKPDMVFVLSVLWLTGAAALLCYGFLSFFRVKREVSASIGVDKNVMACDELPSPFILGIFRPIIYVPSSLNGADLNYVLTHERAHLHRHDHWWKPLGYLLLCVYWFNPLCWLAYILLCRDIESACDERVIRDMDRVGMAAYSQTLLNCSMPAKWISVCPLAFGETGVKERVKNVLNYKKPTFWIIAAALAACIVVAVCFLTSPKKGISAAPSTTSPLEPDIVDRAAENTLPDGWRELTQEEIQTAVDAFQPLYSSESADGLVNCCFTSHYADPKDLDLREFLRYCPSSESANEEEYRALVVSGQLDTGSRWKTLSEMPTPLHRYPAEEVDAILWKFYGIGLDDLNVDYRDKLIYLPESDAFFNTTSDWGHGTFQPTGGETDGQTVILRNEDVMLTLEKDGENWLIRSFLYADGTEDVNNQGTVDFRRSYDIRDAEHQYILADENLTLYDGVNGEETGTASKGTRLTVVQEFWTKFGEIWLQVKLPNIKSPDDKGYCIPLENISVWTEELREEIVCPWYLPGGSRYWLADSKDQDHSLENTVYPENERSTMFDLTCSLGEREGDYTYVYASGGVEAWVLTAYLQVGPDEEVAANTQRIAVARQIAQKTAHLEAWGAELIYLYRDGAEEIHVYFPVQDSGDYVCVRFTWEMEYLRTDYIPESEVPPYYEEAN